MVACRAINQIKHEVAVQKRGAGQVRGGSAFDLLADNGGAGDGERTPLEQALLADCYRHYVEALPERLRAFAEAYLAGSTNKETAAALGCSERTVERKVALILERWQEMPAASVVQSL
jgi:DNA-directed RNA polymerase specialized sigma24 family protein